jgi:hypothetical protein
MVNEIEKAPVSHHNERLPAPPESRALVVVEAVSLSMPAKGSAPRASASFLAHLIATRHQAPQTRAKRRAGSGDAASAYGVRLTARRKTQSVSYSA